MGSTLDKYSDICGPDVIDQLRQLVAPLKGVKVVHVNSTRVGGGVAEILAKLVPLKKELGLDYRLDATHYVEYRQEDFRQEMDDAGLRVEHCDIKWGEIWAVASGTVRGGI